MRRLFALTFFLWGFAHAAAPFQDLIMIDAAVGWGLDAGQVYRTHDGAQHWQEVSFKHPEKFCSLGRGATRKALWVTCSPLRSSLVTQAEGRLYQTKTAGASWINNPLPLGGDPYAQRLDKQRGYLTTLIAQGMGHVDFGFAQTLDDARNWRVRSSENPDPLGQNGQTFPTYDTNRERLSGDQPF